MRLLSVIALAVCCGSPATAQGFTFGGGRDHPYPNEPQYQYPSTGERGRTAHRCPRGQAPFQGQCRKIRWLPGSPQSR
jgi:hypothetical protein